jgi:hypothetical protein
MVLAKLDLGLIILGSTYEILVALSFLNFICSLGVWLYAAYCLYSIYRGSKRRDDDGWHPYQCFLVSHLLPQIYACGC